jgi:hypothetical protein
VQTTVRFIAISVGTEHTCGLGEDGRGYCWGSNNGGKLGNGTQTASLVPVEVTGGRSFVSIAAGGAHTCAASVTGSAFCWGYNGTGGLGTANTVQSLTPVAVQQGTNVFFEVDAGESSSCALTTSHTALCWGTNSVGQGGYGTAFFRTVPTAVTGSLAFSTLGTAAENSFIAHACGVTDAGDVACWGLNTRGQLGASSSDQCDYAVSTFPCSRAPIAVVAGGLTFKRVAAGAFHTCALGTDHAIRCWGANDAGALGDGTTVDRTAPVLVNGGLRFP